MLQRVRAAGRAAPAAWRCVGSRWLAASAESSSGEGLHVALQPLDYEGVFELSLSRPAARNAIGRQLLRELRDCLTQLARERTTRAVLVRVGGGGAARDTRGAPPPAADDDPPLAACSAYSRARGR